jgi:signal transduction histidine kinase
VVLILFETDRLAHQRARFAAAAAHELKTPLSSLMLHSEMLAESMGKPENSARYAAVVAAEAERMSRLVTNMLDLARLEQGALVAASSPGDLAVAVGRCIERLRPRLEEVGLAVEITVAPDLPQARFDQDALCQILDNLLDNAEKYTRSVADRRVTIRLQEADGCVIIAVADNGPGIPRHKRRALFKAFSRLAEQGGASGLGLGLALARSLAVAQGGDLELGDEDGTGATFLLTLPQA